MKPNVGTCSVVIFDPLKEFTYVLVIPNSQVWDNMGIQKGSASPLQGQVVGVKNLSPYVLLGTTTTTTQEVQETNVDANDLTTIYGRI